MPAEVVLMMDLAGVLTSSPFPAARRLAEGMMRCVFSRAGSHMISVLKDQHSADYLARQYSSFFYVAIDFTERTRGMKSAYERLELGEIFRLEFIRDFTNEIDFMLQALTKQNPEELEAMGVSNPKRVEALRKRFPLLSDPVIQILIRELLDVESFLCTVEKVSPRKNVLNLLHYLRMRSQQEIRLIAMGNCWETEGQYQRLVKAMSLSLSDTVSSSFPVSCPVEYACGGYKATFNVNGLFDGNVQSHLIHMRKPYPDIYLHALEEVMRGRTPTGEALRYGIKPHIFYFDDIDAHCDVAKNLPGHPFTGVYTISNGSIDVYHSILDALRSVAAKDSFWDGVVKDVERNIGPLFQPPVDPQGQPVSWVTEELYNYNHNLLFIPPPPCDFCHPVKTLEKDSYRLDEEDQDAILYYCAQHLQHLFPLTIPEQAQKGMKLAQQPGFATSAGPIVFEHFEGTKYFESYRITLRTGSYTLRIQPRGPTPYGSADIKREYETMEHLRETAPAARLPKMLLYCDSYAVCGRRFFVRRFVDGERISRITQLIQPRIRRPYSQRRMLVNIELQPKHFYVAAIDALAVIHSAALPRFLRRKEERVKQTAKDRVPPLLRRIREWMDRYNIFAGSHKPTNSALSLRSTAVESLARELLQCFDETQIAQQFIPSPERLVIVHGNFDMRSLIFSHRSFEGRAKYPPALLAVMNFKFSRLDDPLLDVAKLALFHYLPAPEGIYAVPRDVQRLFPSPAEILEHYCSVRGYMRHLDRRRRVDIFSVYLSAVCLQQATMTITELAATVRSKPDSTSQVCGRQVAFADQLAHRGLELLLQRKNAKM